MRWVSSGWFPVGGLGLAFALASAASSPAQARAGFTAGSSIGRAVAAAVELGASTGVCVLDERGEVAFEHAAAELFAPASNMKVLTAAAVLRGLGSEHRFVTRFELAEGLLVVRASGDPNWITHTVHAPAAAFGEVVAELQRRGVVALRGIRLDPGSFTGAARPASWPQNQLHTYYCAPTGAFVLDQGTFALRIDPAGRRDRALVRFDGPLVGPPLGGDIELVARRGVSTCGAIDRDDHVLVRGDLSRSSAPVRIQTAVADPAVWFERSLRDLLARAGIALRADAAAPPDGPVHEVMTTLAPAMLRMLEDSSNFDAEQCLRALGAARGDGSLQGGLQAMRGELAAICGPLPAGVVLADGSGLSADNRVSPRLVAHVLHAARRESFGAMLGQALPIAGRTGTLEDRFVGSALAGRVRAKTGWIRGVSALSGYVEAGDRTWTFAILMGYDRRRSGFNKDLKRAQERIVAAIADAL